MKEVVLLCIQTFSHDFGDMCANLLMLFLWTLIRIKCSENLNTE